MQRFSSPSGTSCRVTYSGIRPLRLPSKPTDQPPGHQVGQKRAGKQPSEPRTVTNVVSVNPWQSIRIGVGFHDPGRRGAGTPVMLCNEVADRQAPTSKRVGEEFRRLPGELVNSHLAAGDFRLRFRRRQSGKIRMTDAVRAKPEALARKL